MAAGDIVTNARAGHSAKATRYNIFVVLFLALGSFTYGYDNAALTNVLGQQAFFEYFGLATSGPGESHTNAIEGTLNGLFSAGGFFGALAMSWMADRLGRKLSIQIASVICVIGAALQGGSINVGMLLASRFITGIGVGMEVVIVPLFQSEIAPPHARGFMVGQHGVMVCFGYAMAGWCGYGSYFASSDAFRWRFPLAAQCVIPLVLIIGSPLLPESPRWLIGRGRHTQARVVLERLHGDPLNLTDNTFAQHEVETISNQLRLDSDMHAANGKWEVLTRPSYRKRLICGMYCQFLGQATGVLVINNYQISLFTALGISGSQPLMLNAVYNTFCTIQNGICALIVDRFGRVRLLLIGVVGCAICLALEAAMVAQFGGTTNRVGNAFGVFFLFCFIGVYALCINATSYIYCGEIFPTHMRSQGVAFSLTAQFITTIIFVQTAPMGFANIGWRFYLIFIVCCCVSAFILYFYFPETKQKSLEEIGEAFGDEIAQSSAVGRATDVKSGELEDVRQLEDVSDHSKSV